MRTASSWISSAGLNTSPNRAPARAPPRASSPMTRLAREPVVSSPPVAVAWLKSSAPGDSVAGPLGPSLRSRILQQRPEGQHPEPGVERREHGQQAAPRPPLAGCPRQRRLEGPGGTDQDRGHDGEQQQRQEGLPDPEARSEDAVEATGGSQ